MGRVEWQSDRYAAGSNPAANNYIDNTTLAPATFSVYDEAGRVTETRRYKDVLIKVEPDIAVSANTTILRAVASDGVLLSTSKTAFDSAGRVSSQTDAAGLRTETTYYDDGRVRNVRPIVANADGSANAGTSYDYDFEDGQGNWHRQDRVTDALSHTTTTDYDDLGRAVKVTYADGSFTETLYGNNGHPPAGILPKPDLVRARHGTPPVKEPRDHQGSTARSGTRLPRRPSVGGEFIWYGI
jgi:YD repeat-containing protein